MANFAKCLLGPSGQAALLDYWDRQKDEEWVKEHPAFKTHNLDPAYCVPMGMHADKGQHVKRDKLLETSWGGALSPEDTEWTSQHYAGIPDDIIVKHVTDEELYAYFVWSFHWMLLGVWPDVDPFGEPWPEGSRRALMAGQRLAGQMGSTKKKIT